jgi:hypothetical protein
MARSCRMIGCAMRLVRRLTCSAIALLTLTATAGACVGPHIRLYPTCDVTAPRSDERVALIYAYGGQALSSAALGGDDNVTEAVDVEIGAADKPHYIALSSGKSVIWRFSGRIDTISRVMVLGSQLAGAAQSGVVGVPRERVHFVAPDLELLNRAPRTTCHATYRACDLSAVFAIQNPDRSELAGTAPAHRYGVDQFVEHIRAARVRIPQDGNVEAPADESIERLAGGGTAITHRGRGRQEYDVGADYYETSAAYPLGLVAIDPAEVVSAGTVRPYDILPASAGIAQLVADGTLVAPSSQRFKRAYEEWDAAISAPYRSRLDPDFRFAYQVDYLITRPMRLPAGLDGTIFLVDANVPPPAVRGAGPRTCIFFADRRALRVDSAEEIDARCDRRGGAPGLPHWQRGLVAAQEALDHGRPFDPTSTAACTTASVPDGAYFVGIAAAEQPDWDRDAGDGTARRVDVVVKRAGRVALYLEMNGGPTDWHVMPSPGSEVSAVFLGSPATGAARDEVFGLKLSVPVRQLHAPDSEPACAAFNPDRHSHLGGPAAIALDESLKALAGRGLDRLLRETDPGEWPPIEGDGAGSHVTFVVE